MAAWLHKPLGITDAPECLHSWNTIQCSVDAAHILEIQPNRLVNNTMRPEFTKLAHGDPRLEKWFQLAHCNTCGEFTSQPCFLGCSEDHTFCENCVALNIIMYGNHCVECRHTFYEVNSTMFSPHASALVGLLHVKMPREAQALEHLLHQTGPDESFLRRLISTAANRQLGQSAVLSTVNTHISQSTGQHTGIELHRRTISAYPK